MVVDMMMISSIAAALSAATSVLRKLIFKKEDYAKMAEIQAFNRELMNATRKKDQKTIQKLQKKKAYIQQINAEVTKKNLITMFSSLMIFFTVYPLLVSFFGDVVVGVTPNGLNIPFITESGQLKFYGWFILSFFGVSSPIAKALGLGLTGMQPVRGDKDEKRPADAKQKEEND
ncbi:MAG: EMC3/TMCO1 family protein [Candidatus Caldarchaeum sp.]|nr:EMC3/TMCO1 family protein [Candidatus Caldarchaeum sp.]